MTSLDALAEYIDTAAKDDSFTIETQMTGAVLVRNVPQMNLQRLTSTVSDDIALANVQALRTLASKNITTETAIYTLETQTADNGNKTNARFHLKYTGPRLKEKVRGIHSSKEDASKLLHEVVRSNVAKIKLEILNAAKGKGGRKIDNVSIVFRYGVMNARYKDAQMVFQIVPNKKEYGHIIKEIMPQMLERHVIRCAKFDEKSGQSVWQINAAGKAWLVRVATYLEKHMKR